MKVKVYLSRLSELQSQRKMAERAMYRYAEKVIYLDRQIQEEKRKWQKKSM